MTVWTIFAVIFTCSVVLAYPVLLLLFDWIVGKDRNPEDNPYRLKAGTLVLQELEIVETVNAMRKDMGQEPIEHRPIIRSLKTRQWDYLRATCEGQVREAINRIAGKEGPK